MTDTPPATRVNWRTAPHNRWAFHNSANVVPVEVIGHVSGKVMALGAGPAALDCRAIVLIHAAAAIRQRLASV